MTSDIQPRKSGIRVLIAHSNSMSTELLIGALKRQSRFEVLACTPSVEGVSDTIRSWRPDVVLIHTNLAEGPLSGFTALRQNRSATRGIILLDKPDRQLVVEAFRSGARGVFCPPQSDFKMICKCIDRVFAGQIWARNTELEYVLDAFATSRPVRVVDAAGMEVLSKREAQVVQLLVEGLTNREIAHRLALSEHTVKNYLFKIFDKVAVSNRVELALYAVNCANRFDLPPREKQLQEQKRKWIAEPTAAA